MKELISKKFDGIKHKWITFHIDTDTFQNIVYKIDLAVKEGNYKSRDAISLVKSFKLQEKAWIKFSKTKGRKNFKCICYIIDIKNNKLEIEVEPEVVLDSKILNGTPKSLKLYNKEKKSKGNWTKPDDGFIDPIEYPPVEEELTELGYEMYKEWELEIKNSGLSREEYKKKLFGVSVIYRRKWWFFNFVIFSIYT